MVRKVCRLNSIHTNLQANKAQQDKLAALKTWAHIDTFDGKAIRGVKDNLLYNMLRQAYKDDEAKAVRMANNGEPPIKKLRGDSDSFSSSRSTSPSIKLESESDAGNASDDSDEEPVRIPRRRKTHPSLSRAISSDEGGLDRVKKHNLQKIAADGGVGRVLFVFEKESKSRL